MNDGNIDPAPRTYPAFVTLLRRARFDPEDLRRFEAGDVGAWLTGEAANENDLLELFQSFACRLVAVGLPLHRASLHVGTLHPQFFGYAWNWEFDDGICDEVKVDESVLKTDSYRRNPLFRVVEHGERFRSRFDDPEGSPDSPVLQDLAARGVTDYAALPLRAAGGQHNAATVATKQPGGFTDRQFEEICAHLSLFALHVQRHIIARISENVMSTYLGTAAGEQVLSGAIKRGSGAPIDAIIWVSDLRGFTDLADRLDDRDMIAVLNAYFERLAGAVMDHGGEVLKFIGDGLLAVFPFAAFGGERDAAKAALAASRAAVAAMDDLNADDNQLGDIEGWRPLRSGIALHRGAVFFGNVGAPQRLDFTVIGKAVNTASRVEGLSKSLGRPVLITGDVAGLLDEELEGLGEHALRGLAEPVEIFAPKA